jgi:Spy/CpxP family protein refolding chaperone
MTRKAYYLIAVGVIAALAFTPVIYAHGSGPGSWGGSPMGGSEYAMMGGQGMMGGGQGGGMRGYGQGGSNLWGELNRMFNGSNQQSYSETETLRREIRQRRQELASLFGAAKPDQKLIHEKIEELNKLEAELDRKMAASN